jgi:hypothetical protein
MFKIEMQTDNSAFGDTREDNAREVARILRQIADKLKNDEWASNGMHQTIFDLNGNDVGRFVLKGSDAVRKSESDTLSKLRRKAGIK